MKANYLDSVYILVGSLVGSKHGVVDGTEVGVAVKGLAVGFAVRTSRLKSWCFSRRLGSCFRRCLVWR